MIGSLSGIVAARGADHVLIEVGGVGYVVHCSERTLAALPPAGQAVRLHTELLVREDLLQLFGFLTLQEREWHRLLQSVQGVGAKAALSILGALGAAGVSRAIALGDWAAVKAAPGIGPKLAQRVVNELRDKAAGVMAMGAEPGVVVEPAAETGEAPARGPGRAEPVAAPQPGAEAEALSALVNLGYGHGEAASAVAAVAGEGVAETPALIRAALRRLAPDA